MGRPCTDCCTDHSNKCRDARVQRMQSVQHHEELEGGYPQPQTGIPTADLMAEVGGSAAGIQYLASGLEKVLARKNRFAFCSCVLDNNSSVTIQLKVSGVPCCCRASPCQRSSLCRFSCFYGLAYAFHLKNSL